MIVNEFVELLVKTKAVATRWNGLYDLNCHVGDTVKIHWSKLVTSKYRRKLIDVVCDECNRSFKRRINSLKEKILCRSCIQSGERNYGFGKPRSIENIKATKKWLLENGNPFQRPYIKQLLKEKWHEHHSINNGMANKKHSDETKQKMSEIALKQFKSGERKVNSGWGHVKIKSYKGINYQSTYELKFLKHLDENNWLHIIERGPRITYRIDAIEHSYFSDYKIKNTNIVIEIKSSYMWKKHLKINEIKKLFAEKMYDYHIILDNKFDYIDNKMKGNICCSSTD